MDAVRRPPPRPRDVDPALWRVATHPAVARAWLIEHRGAVCADCQTEVHPGDRPWWWGLAPDDRPATWQAGPPEPYDPVLYVDHVRPLWSLSDEQRLDGYWWLPDNLQLLCRADHQRKTAREARDRALARRTIAA